MFLNSFILFAYPEREDLNLEKTKCNDFCIFISVRMVNKAEVEKEQKLKAALDRVNALEQELTETKKVNS